MSILFMFSYNSITVLLCLETWKIHINNTSVGLQKYIWKCQFTFICTLCWRSKRPEAIEWGRLKCCLQFSLPLSFQKAEIIIILSHSSPMDLFVSWIVSFLFMVFPEFCHLPCLQSLAAKAATCFLCGAIARVAKYYEHDPTTHLAVHYTTQACYLFVWGRPRGNHHKSAKRISTDDIWKKTHPLMKWRQLRNMLNRCKDLRAISESSSWGVKKPINYHGTEDNVAGMAEVSNGWVGMTHVFASPVPC